MPINLLEKPKDRPSCHGQIFKCVENSFRNTRGDYVSKLRMVHQRRLSCNGCDACGWQLDTLSEFVSAGAPISIEVGDGQYATLTTKNQHRDWETGIVDDYDLAFVLVNVKELQKEKKRIKPHT